MRASGVAHDNRTTCVLATLPPSQSDLSCGASVLFSATTTATSIISLANAKYIIRQQRVQSKGDVENAGVETSGSERIWKVGFVTNSCQLPRLSVCVFLMLGNC